MDAFIGFYPRRHRNTTIRQCCLARDTTSGPWPRFHGQTRYDRAGRFFQFGSIAINGRLLTRVFEKKKKSAGNRPLETPSRRFAGESFFYFDAAAAFRLKWNQGAANKNRRRATEGRIRTAFRRCSLSKPTPGGPLARKIACPPRFGIATSGFRGGVLNTICRRNGRGGLLPWPRTLLDRKTNAEALSASLQKTPPPLPRAVVSQKVAGIDREDSSLGPEMRSI